MKRFIAAIKTRGDRKIAEIRQKSADRIQDLQRKATAASNGREEMAAKLAVMRRGSLFGGERLRDSFDL